MIHVTAITKTYRNNCLTNTLYQMNSDNTSVESLFVECIFYNTSVESKLRDNLQDYSIEWKHS